MKTLEEIVAEGPPHGTNWSGVEPQPCECQDCENWSQAKRLLEYRQRMKSNVGRMIDIMAGSVLILCLLYLWGKFELFRHERRKEWVVDRTASEGGTNVGQWNYRELRSKSQPQTFTNDFVSEVHKIEFLTGFGLYIEAGKDVYQATNPNDYTVKWSTPDGTWTATWRKD